MPEGRALEARPATKRAPQKWEPGGPSPNPNGRGPSGKQKVMAVLEKLMGKRKNLKLLEEELQQAFQEDPIKFIKTFALPFLPKHSLVELTAETKRAVEIHLIHEDRSHLEEPRITYDLPGEVVPVVEERKPMQRRQLEV